MSGSDKQHTQAHRKKTTSSKKWTETEIVVKCTQHTLVIVLVPTKARSGRKLHVNQGSQTQMPHTILSINRQYMQFTETCKNVPINAYKLLCPFPPPKQPMHVHFMTGTKT